MAVLIGLYAARLGMSAAADRRDPVVALWGAALAALLTLWLGPRTSQRAMLVTLSSLPVRGLRGDAHDRFLRAPHGGGVRRHVQRERPRPGRDPHHRAGDLPRDHEQTPTARASSPGTTCCSTRATPIGGLLAALPTLLEHSMRASMRSPRCARRSRSSACLYVAGRRALLAHPAPRRRRGIRGARAPLAGEPPHRHEDLGCSSSSTHSAADSWARRCSRTSSPSDSACPRRKSPCSSPRGACSRPARTWSPRGFPSASASLNTMIYTHVPSSPAALHDRGLERFHGRGVLLPACARA